MDQDIRTQLLIEAVLTLIEATPALLDLLSKTGGLKPEEVALYREKVQQAMSRLENTWEDYLEEAQKEKESLEGNNTIGGV